MIQDRSFSIHDALPEKRLKEGNLYLSLTTPIELFERDNLDNPINVKIIRIGVNMDMTNLDKSVYASRQIENLARYYHPDIKAWAIMGNYANINNYAKLNHSKYDNIDYVYRESDRDHLFSKNYSLTRYYEKIEITGKYFAGCTIVNNLPKTVVERAMALKITCLCDEYNKNHIDKIILGGCHKAVLLNNEYQWACEWFNNRQIDTIEKFLEYVRKYTIPNIENPMMQVYA